MEIVKRKVGGRGKDLKPRKTFDMKPAFAGDMKAKAFLNNFIDLIERDANEHLTLHFDVTSLGKTREVKYSPRELLQRGLTYFRFALESDRMVTMGALAIALNYNPSKVVRMKDGEDTEIGYVINKLRGYVEMNNEESIHTKQNPVGNIFVLKNMGWKDNVDVNIRPVLPMSTEERENAKSRLRNFSE